MHERNGVERKPIMFSKGLITKTTPAILESKQLGWRMGKGTGDVIALAECLRGIDDIVCSIASYKPGMVAHLSNPSTQEVGVGGADIKEWTFSLKMVANS